MSDLIKFAGSAVADVTAIDAQLDKALAKAPAVNSGQPYLKISQKTGKWGLGAEGTQVEDDSEWAINPASLMHGFVCWSNPKVTKKKAELLGEIMVPAPEDLPPSSTLDDHSDSGGVWKDAVGFDLACVSGEDEGEQVVYNSSSGGGCKAYRDVLQEIRNRPEPDYFVPIVVFSETNYVSNYGETVYNPIFKVVGWANAAGERLEGDVADAGADEQPTETENPPRRRRRSA